MTDIRISQFPIETLQGGDGELRVSQFPIETIQDGSGELRLSQLAIETLQANPVPIRVSQFVIETLQANAADIYVSVTVGAVDISSYILKETVEIEEVLFGSTAHLVVKGPPGFAYFADALHGRPISILVSTPSGSTRIFAGHILSATQINRSVQVRLPLYELRCIDYSWQLDWRTVQGRRWTQVPAEQIVEEMIADFAPSFTVDAQLGGIILPPDVGPTFPERLTFAAGLPRIGDTWTNGQAIAEEIGGTMAAGDIVINITGVQIINGVSYESDVSNPAGIFTSGQGVRASWDRPSGGEIYDHYRIYVNRTNGGHRFHPYDDDLSGTPSARFVTHDNATFDGNPLAGTRHFSKDITSDTDGTDYLQLSSDSVDGLVDFESNSDEAPSAFLTRLMAFIGGYWWLDYDKVVHARLLTAEPDGAQPATLDSSNSNYRLFTHQRDVSQARTRVRCLGASTTTTAGAAAGASSVAVDDVSIFSGGGFALVGPNRISYTGRSASAGAGNLTGVSGMDHSVDAGDTVQVVAEESDSYGAAVVAALSGGDGIIEHVITDTSADDAQARQLAHADLLLNSTPDATITFQTWDPLAVPGRTVTVDLAIAETGEEIQDAFTIQSVHVDMCGFAPSLYPRRQVTAGRSRQDLYELLGPLASLAPR